MNCIKYDYIKLLYYIKFYIQGSKGEREGGGGIDSTGEGEGA